MASLLRSKRAKLAHAMRRAETMPGAAAAAGEVGAAAAAVAAGFTGGRPQREEEGDSDASRVAWAKTQAVRNHLANEHPPMKG